MEPAEPHPRRRAISCLPFWSFFTKVDSSVSSDEEADPCTSSASSNEEPDRRTSSVSSDEEPDRRTSLVSSRNLDSILNSDEEADRRTCVFTYKELKKATNQFQRVLGCGGYGSVYFGKLQDKRRVAVKVLHNGTRESVEQFNNEVKVLSRLCHPYMVDFYGCTKPDKKLLLVCGFVPNGTLAYHLHVRRQSFPWSRRMRIAIEIAAGLWYLHSAKSPIIHRDVKPENILLDHAFHVKVADFGLSCLLPSDGTDFLTVTPGTMGYQDPEYQRVFKVTDKCDVYSFGVVLLELISRKKAVDIHRGPDEIYLDEIGLNMIINGELELLVDPEIGYSDSDVRKIIDKVADLAYKCLRPKGVMRPPMFEVLSVLKDIENQMQKPTVIKEMESKSEYMRGRRMSKPMSLNILDTSKEDVFSWEGEDVSSPSYFVESARLFLYEELKEATNSFRQPLGDDGYGRTYLGKLQDGQMVAVKKLHDNPRLLVKFFNEAMIHYRLRHENLIALYGYTKPQNEELLLVYEFVANGTVADHLHENKTDLTWAVRMQVALQTAEALVYLHALDPPVIHRNVKTTNILLDNTFHAKLADLSLCHVLPPGTTHVSTLPQGTQGYRDPEYDRTCRLSDKTDVYSFGVVLVELISGQRAVDVERATAASMDEVYLDRMFLIKVTNNKLDELVDPKLEYHLDTNVRMMIDSVSELARQCLQPKGKARPPMAEVLDLLKGIKDGCNVLEEVSGFGV